jgi:hypothetical protein
MYLACSLLRLASLFSSLRSSLSAVASALPAGTDSDLCSPFGCEGSLGPLVVMLSCGSVLGGMVVMRFTQ